MPPPEPLTLVELREHLPARAKRSIKATVNSRAPLFTMYVCEIEIDGRVVATGTASDPFFAESRAIRAYQALLAGFGQRKGTQ